MRVWGLWEEIDRKMRGRVGWGLCRAWRAIHWSYAGTDWSDSTGAKCPSAALPAQEKSVSVSFDSKAHGGGLGCSERMSKEDELELESRIEWR
jgi:hypothetical protein